MIHVCVFLPAECDCNPNFTWECKSLGKGRCNCKGSDSQHVAFDNRCDPMPVTLPTTPNQSTIPPHLRNFKTTTVPAEPRFCRYYDNVDCSKPGAKAQCPKTCHYGYYWTGIHISYHADSNKRST